MTKTEAEYRQVIERCKSLFLKKNQDYGTAWRILRLPSITDQIFIKAQRIRTLQETGISKDHQLLRDGADSARISTQYQR